MKSVRLHGNSLFIGNGGDAAPNVVREVEREADVEVELPDAVAAGNRELAGGVERIEGLVEGEHVDAADGSKAGSVVAADTVETDLNAADAVEAGSVVAAD